MLVKKHNNQAMTVATPLISEERPDICRLQKLQSGGIYPYQTQSEQNQHFQNAWVLPVADILS